MQAGRRDAGRQVCVEFVSTASHHMRLLARALLLLLAPPSAFSRACQPLFPHLTRRTGLCALPHYMREVWWLNEIVGYASSTEFIEALRTALQEASYQQQPRYHAPRTSQRAASHEMDNTRRGTSTTTTPSDYNHNDVGNDCYDCYIVCFTRDCMKRVSPTREAYLPRHILVCPRSTQPTSITSITCASDRRCHGAVSPGRRLCDSSSHTTTTTTTNNITSTATSTADVCKGRVTVGASDVDDVKKTAVANDSIVRCHVALPDIPDDTLLCTHPAATAQCVKELTRQLGQLWRQIEQQQNEEGQNGEYTMTTTTTSIVVKEDERASVWALILREAVLASLQCERCLYGTITTPPSSPSSRPVRPRLPIYASILLGNSDVGKEEEGGGGNMRQIRALIPMEWLRGMRVQREFHITTEFFGSKYSKRRSTTPAHEAAMEHRLVQLVALAGQPVQVTLLCVVRNAKAVAIVVRNACRDTRTQSGCEGAEEKEEEEDVHNSRHSEAEEQNEDEEGRSIAADVRRGDTEDEDTACWWGSLNTTTTTSRLVRQEFPCGNAVAHITIATADGVAPVYSNVLCAPHYDSRTEGKRQVHRLPRHTVVTGVFSPL